MSLLLSLWYPGSGVVLECILTLLEISLFNCKYCSKRLIGLVPYFDPLCFFSPISDCGDENPAGFVFEKIKKVIFSIVLFYKTIWKLN